MRSIPCILIGYLLLSTATSFGQSRQARLLDSPCRLFSERQRLPLPPPCLPADPLALLLEADSSVTEQEYRLADTVLARHVQALKARRTAQVNPVRFLRWMFHKTHRQFLKRFVAYAPFSQLVEDGVYNCVSASALFALLLEELGYSCQLYETPFHLYLLVEYKPGKWLLLESTDPYAGIVTGKRAVARRIARYSRPDSSDWCVRAALCTTDVGCPTQFSRPISLVELAGLQYVNEAIRYYNRLELDLARNWLQRGKRLYPSSRRIRGLENYLMLEESRARSLSQH